MDRWPKVAIIILNWNGWRDTIECLESLQRITYPNYQIIVVDNGSTDDSVEKIKVWARGEISVESKFFEYDPSNKPVQWIEYDRPTAEAGGIPKENAEIESVASNRRMVLIQTGENLGFAGGVNVGLRFALRAKQPYSWIVGNDTVVGLDTLSQLVKTMRADFNIGIVGPKIYQYEEQKRFDSAGGEILPWYGLAKNIGQNALDSGQYEEVKKVDCVIGCNMLIRSSIVIRTGFLDERFFMYLEETDWHLRIRKAGWQIIYVPTTSVWHKASKKKTTKLQREYYFTRNRLLFTVKHYPYLFPIVCSRTFGHILKLIIKRQQCRAEKALQGWWAFWQRKWGPVTPQKHMNIRRSLAIIHPAFSLGGAGAVAVWTLEALKKDYHVILLTTEDIDLTQINDFFGSDLKPEDIEIRRIISYPVRSILNSFLLKIALAQRYYNRYREEFDLAIATRCEMDLGELGIAYVHCPIWNDEVLRQLNQLPQGWRYRRNLARQVYKKVCMLISGGFSSDGVKKNITLVNSNWMGKKVEEAYDVSTRTVYPPVKDDFPEIPWNEREEGFVCIGAVSPGKYIEDMISIIDRVRYQRPQVHLHIIGGCSNLSYAEKIKQLCKKNSDWLFWDNQLTRAQLTRLVAQHKYGIHGMPNEHFGIAVAEMVKAGCIPFVPNSGGQVEIVGDARLRYADPDEAKDKILYILQHERIHAEFRESLRTQGRKFSTIVFMKTIKEIVDQTLGVENSG